MSHRKAQLVINAYPVLVLSDEWLEELFCPQCGSRRWCHITKHNRVEHTVRWAPPELWGSRLPMWIRCSPTPRWASTRGAQHGGRALNGPMANGSMITAEG